MFAFIRVYGSDAGFEPRPAVMPTTAMPGTAEKIRVLAARLLAGEELWHPDDPVIAWQPHQIGLQPSTLTWVFSDRRRK